MALGGDSIILVSALYGMGVAMLFFAWDLIKRLHVMILRRADIRKSPLALVVECRVLTVALFSQERGRQVLFLMTVPGTVVLQSLRICQSVAPACLELAACLWALQAEKMSEWSNNDLKGVKSNNPTVKHSLGLKGGKLQYTETTGSHLIIALKICFFLLLFNISLQSFVFCTVNINVLWNSWQLRSALATLPLSDELQAPLASVLRTWQWAKTSWGGSSFRSSPFPRGLMKGSAKPCLCSASEGTSPRRRPSPNTARNGKMRRAKSSWRRISIAWRNTARLLESWLTLR